MVFVEKVAIARLECTTWLLGDRIRCALWCSFGEGALSPSPVSCAGRRSLPCAGARSMRFPAGPPGQFGSSRLTAPRCSRRSTTRRGGPAAWVLSVGPERGPGARARSVGPERGPGAWTLRVGDPCERYLCARCQLAARQWPSLGAWIRLLSRPPCLRASRASAALAVRSSCGLTTHPGRYVHDSQANSPVGQPRKGARDSPQAH